MLDLRQTSKYAGYMTSIGWQVFAKKGCYAYVRKIPFLGNFIKLQRPEKLTPGFINNLVEDFRPFKLVIEPKNINQSEMLLEKGFRLQSSYFVPSKTIEIDLGISEKELLKRMHYKTRYNIKKLLNSGLKPMVTDDIKYFAGFWQSCALKQRGMFLSQKTEIEEIYNSFKDNSEILLIKDKEEVLAGILLIYTKDVAYYMYAASSSEGKKRFAPTLAVWEAFRLSRKRGCKLFDFEGIYDKRFPIRSWIGFTRFKNSFGGKEIEYPGCYYKFYLPFNL